MAGARGLGRQREGLVWLNFAAPSPPRPRCCRDAEKEAAPLLRQASSARQALESVVSAALAASQEVSSLKEEEKAAGREADAARKEVRRLESLARGGR